MREINDVTQLIGHLLNYIDPITFILKKKIIFLQDTVYHYKKLDINSKNIRKKITETWLNRLCVYEASSIEHFRNMDEKINELKNILKQFKCNYLKYQFVNMRYLLYNVHIYPYYSYYVLLNYLAYPYRVVRIPKNP